MSSDPTPARTPDATAAEAAGGHQTARHMVAGLDLTFVQCSSALVTAIETDTGRWVANVAFLVTGVRSVYHNHQFREQFGLNQFQAEGRQARRELAAHAARLLAG